MAKIISTNGSISSGMAIGAAVASALNDVGVNPGLLQRTYENVVRNGGTATISGPKGTAQVIPEMPSFSQSYGHTPMQLDDRGLPVHADPIARYVIERKRKIALIFAFFLFAVMLYIAFHAGTSGNIGGAVADIFIGFGFLIAGMKYNSSPKPE